MERVEVDEIWRTAAMVGVKRDEGARSDSIMIEELSKGDLRCRCSGIGG